MKHIAILDFGSQYTHVIARNIREMNVLAKIYPHDVSKKQLDNAIGIILSGGPQSVYSRDGLKPKDEILNMGLPILGICYGHQYLAHHFGGTVKQGKTHEYGRAKFHIKKEVDFFKKVKDISEVWMSHGDSVTKLPKNFVVTGYTKDCRICAMANTKRHIYGVQFHPEVDHSQEGSTMLKNFILKICKAKQDWKVSDLIDELTQKIKNQVGDKKVFILVSGGVDSNVAFSLLTKALGKKRVIGLYIDNGFMRLDESRRIKERYKKIGFTNFKAVNAGSTFLKNVKEVYEPEEKRHIIGHTFLDVKDEAIKKLKLNPKEWLLGQGTIYPDIVESGGTKNADKIKTHHNRVKAIEDLIKKGLVIEPLADFYKYEVRMIGKMLKLPKELINRHPFPGPGLSIRCLCYDSKQKKENLTELNKKIEKLYQKKYPKIKHEILPIKSVGVQGDNRSYAHMMAVWGEKSWEKLDFMSSFTTNTIKGINRLILLLNPPKNKKSIIRLPDKNLYLTKERLDILREVDDIVNRNIKKAKIYDDIWQFPVILLPIVDEQGKESIGLRPFNSRDVMTVKFYRMQKTILKKIQEEILATGKISYVFYDITNKPPGTTEWE